MWTAGQGRAVENASRAAISSDRSIMSLSADVLARLACKPDRSTVTRGIRAVRRRCSPAELHGRPGPSAADSGRDTFRSGKNRRNSVRSILVTRSGSRMLSCGPAVTRKLRGHHSRAPTYAGQAPG